MHQTLWDFSLGFYDNPQVQQACLRLQDECGADVNLMLLLLFRASQGRCIAGRRIAAIDAEVSTWRDRTTVPLRAIRRTLKDAETCLSPSLQEEFRTRVKALELQSEKLVQQHLEAIDLSDSAMRPPKEAATINLSAYVEFLRADEHHPAFRLLRQRFDSMLERPDD